MPGPEVDTAPTFEELLPSLPHHFIFHRSPLYTLCSSPMQTLAGPSVCAHTLCASCFFPTLFLLRIACPLPVIWGSCHPPVFLKQERGPCHVAVNLGGTGSSVVMLQRT